MSKECLGSFLAHPQLKANHANKESAKLTNHDTSGTAPTPAPAASPGGDFPQAMESTPVTGPN